MKYQSAGGDNVNNALKEGKFIEWAKTRLSPT